MNLSTTAAAAGLDAIKALANSGSIVYLSGVMPTTPETALSGNTTLATWTFASTAFGSDSLSGNFEQATASFSASTVTPAANGIVVFARVYKSDGTTVIADLTVIAPYRSTAFTPVLGMLCTNSGNTYKCTTSGLTTSTAPTGTTTSSDGAAVWTYVGSGTLGDLSIGDCNISTGITASISAFLLKIPAV